MTRSTEPADMLRTIAHAYRWLGAILDAQSGGSTGGIGGAFGAKVPVNAHVVDVRLQLERWIHFLARWLMKEVTVERWPGVPYAAEYRTPAEPWAPPVTETAALAEHVAMWRIGHFTHHADEQLRLEFFDDLAEMHSLACRTAWPSGARWLRLGVPCPEHGTSDLGERVACTGEFRMFMRPGELELGDMVCSVDGEHRITPSEWQRAMRRRPIDNTQAARFAATLRLVRIAG